MALCAFDNFQAEFLACLLQRAVHAAYAQCGTHGGCCILMVVSEF